MAVATIITTSDGQALIRFADGTVDVGTVDSLTNKYASSYEAVNTFATNQTADSVIASHKEEFAPQIAAREAEQAIESGQSFVQLGNNQSINYEPFGGMPGNRDIAMLLVGLDPSNQQDVDKYFSALYDDPNSKLAKQVKKASDTAIELVYGVVGSNKDTRDWGSILSAGYSPKELANVVRAATNEMYGGVSVQLFEGTPMLVAGNGTLLRGLDLLGKNPSQLKNYVQQQLSAFGARDASWLNQDWQSQANSYVEKLNNESAIYQQILNNPNSTAEQKAKASEEINNIGSRINRTKAVPSIMESIKIMGQEVYAPFASWENTKGINLITGLSRSDIALQAPKPAQPQPPAEPSQQPAAPGQQPPSGVEVSVKQPEYQPPAQVQQPTQQQTSPYFPTYSVPTQGGIQAPTVSVPTVPTYSPIAPMAPVTGGFTVPTYTGGMSAVPQSITVRPSYTGSPANVPQPLTTPQQDQNQGVRNVMYRNPQGAMMYITEFNGQPMTAVPAGYTKAQGQAEGGMTKQQQPSSPFTPQQKFQLLQRMGYRGPASEAQMQQFIEANPATAARFGRLSRAAMKRTGMAQGGMVPKQTVIAGQPHQLAYINPQEAKMLKDAGGAGLPGPGGIPAYFFLAPGAPAGQTATDPATGTVYTSDGNKWNVTGSGTAGNQNNPVAVAGGTGITTSQINPDFTARATALQQTGAQQPTIAPVSMIQPEAAQFIPSDAGMTVPQAPFAEAATLMQSQQAMMPVVTPASVMQAAGVTPAMQQAAAGVEAARGEVSQQAQVQAAQQTQASMSQLQAAQGQAYMMNNPAQREIQSGELITGAADAAKAAQFVEQIQAAEATPTKQATVQGQLEGLMQQFEGGATPAWAAGAMRNAMATLSARGLGASSLAGQAVIQAAMESALPIAQIDAQTRASFESQNLSNRQQVAMFAAQQRAAFMQMEFDQAFQSRVQNAARIADVANMNFTAEQQVALENSRAANTMNLANLNNRQAMVMAEAAALSNLDMANLNNRQQAAVQNAQNFLQMDMANLGNEQQTALFRAQQVAQALFTDQAAENASRQFNATSENQTNQFFASLSSQVSQFNAAQRNAIDQYNIDQVNSIRRFNSEIQQQRDLFNAQNGLVIAQANAQWRQNLTTLNTAAQNEANRQFAQVLNNMSQTTLDQIWQRERDIMSYSFNQSESALNRASEVLLAQMEIEGKAALEAGKAEGSFMGKIFEVAAAALAKKIAG